MKIVVCGPRLLVRPLKLEEVDDVFRKARAAGIAMPESSEIKREKAALDTGIVVDVGELAWKDWKNPSPWCKAGDKIIWAKHAGKVVHKEGDDVLVVLNDDDVICVIEE